MQFIQGLYDQPREPDMEEAEKSAGSLWGVLLCKKKLLYGKQWNVSVGINKLIN